jgi:hypothetical protein
MRAEIAGGDRRAMPGMVRVSFGSYNTTEEIDVLVDALEQIARGEFRGLYVQDRASGEFAADNWAPGAMSFFTRPAADDAHEPPAVPPALPMAAVGQVVATSFDPAGASDDLQDVYA